MTRAELLRRAEILERAAEMAPIAFAPDDAFIDGWPPWVRCSHHEARAWWWSVTPEVAAAHLSASAARYRRAAGER